MTSEDQVAQTTAAVDKASRTIERSSKFQRMVTLAAAIATFAAVVAFGIVNLVQQADARHKNFIILRGVVEATNPNSAFSKANAAKGQAEIRDLTLCLENHDDRLAAAVLHVKIPPVRPGCP